MQSDPITTSGIDRYGDATVSEVDVQQITVDSQRPLGQTGYAGNPSLKSPEMTSANDC